MDFLRKSVSQIKTQLAGLTVSQRMLIALLLVVIVATAFFVVTSSAKPAMVVLIAQPMTSQEISKAQMYLEGKYQYKVEGDKILVPAAEADAIRGAMFAEQALPTDTTLALTELVHENNIFTSDRNASRQMNIAMQETLSRMLCYFPYIDRGTVIVSPGEASNFGRDPNPSTATVTVRVKNSESLSSRQVDAIVSMIAGSVSGLKRQDVNVIDGQRSYRVAGDDAAISSDLLEFKKTQERDYTSKLYSMFDYIPNVKIAVNAVPDLRARSDETQTYDPKGVVRTDIVETKQTSNTTDSAPGSGEPGVRPNVGLSADAGSGGKNNSSITSNTSTKTEAMYSGTHSKILTQPGSELKDLTASISLPRSFLVAMYKRTLKAADKEKAADPDDAQLKPIIDEQEKMASARAKNVLGAKTDDQVRVDWFDDTLGLTAPEIAVASSGFSANGVGGMMSQYGKQGVLAIFTLGVLGMMLMMVKKAVPAAAGDDVDPSVFFGNSGSSGRRKGTAGNPATLDAQDDVFGEANQGDAVLTGIELDDDTLASRKMVDEVSIMIKDNPENAATLIKRWLAKGK